jgi:DNA polymerase-1
MAVTYATAGLPLPDFITEDWCDDFISKWFGVYKGARKYLDNQEELIRRYGICWTRMGRVRRIPGVRSTLPYIQEAGIREGGNHGIQGYSADIMKLAMAELDDQLNVLREIGIDSWPLMTIYDELIIEAEEDNAYVISVPMGEVMDNVLTDKQTGKNICLVPIQSDGKIMKKGWTKE